MFDVFKVLNLLTEIIDLFTLTCVEIISQTFNQIHTSIKLVLYKMIDVSNLLFFTSNY